MTSWTQMNFPPISLKMGTTSLKDAAKATGEFSAAASVVHLCTSREAVGPTLDMADSTGISATPPPAHSTGIENQLGLNDGLCTPTVVEPDIYLGSDTMVGNNNFFMHKLDLLSVNNRNIKSNTKCSELKNTRTITISHLNIQSIRNKLNQFELMLDKFKCDVISLNGSMKRKHWQMTLAL